MAVAKRFAYRRQCHVDSKRIHPESGEDERGRIAVGEEQGRYLAELFSATYVHLGQAVSAVGHSVAAVDEWLAEHWVVSGFHGERDGAYVHVTAFGNADAWRFRVDVYEYRADGPLHTEALGGRDFPSVDLALAQGDACARWLVAGQDGDSPAAAGDPLTTIHRHRAPPVDWTPI
jgi:hypothetical protein